MTTHWVRRALLAAVLGSLLFGASMARVGSASAEVTRADVFKALKVDQVPADYVVLVDTSGSMRGAKYDGLVRALKPFLKALSPNDYLSLITFDTVPALRYSGKVGNNPEKAIRQLPTVPRGAKTDIGAAIEMALNELERPDAAEVATLAFFTDGKHDPPAGSLYPSTSGPAWRALRKRAAKLDARELAAYAIALTKNTGDTDAALLKQVFPHAQVLGLSSDQLPSYLDRIKEQTRTAKAQSLLRSDVAKGVEVVWPKLTGLDLNAGESKAEVTLRSTAKHLPLQVSGLKAASNGFEVAVAGLPATVTLAPGETKKLPVTLSWTAKKPFHVGKADVTETSALSLAGAVTSSWAAVLKKDLDLKLAATMPENGGAFSATETYGWGWGLIVAIIAIVAAAIAIFVSWRVTRRPKIGGVFRIESRTGNEPPCLVRLGQRRKVAFGGKSKDGAGWPGTGTLTARIEGKSKPGPRGKAVKRRVKLLVVEASPPGSGRQSFTIEMGSSVERSGRMYRWSLS